MTLHAGKLAPDQKIWPEDIAFLADHGVSHEVIENIIIRSQHVSMPFDQVAIGEGFVAEDTYYKALAASLGLKFIEAEELFRLLCADHVRIPQTIQTGIAVLKADHSSGHGFAVAPRGKMISTLMAATPAIRDRLMLTSPSILESCVRKRAERSIALKASHGLSQIHPQLSAVGKASMGQIVAVGFLVLVLSFFGVLEPVSTVFISGLVLGPVFLGLATIRMAAVFEPDMAGGQHNKALLKDQHLPIYTVLVPLYREIAVLPQLINALTSFDYPASKLNIKILVEADDHTMIAALSAMMLAPFIAVLVVPPGKPRTKPRALNAGLSEARGTLLTIYDAEDVPEPGQLRIAASIMKAESADMACIQARLVIDNANDSLMTRAFALEYAGLFDVINPGLVRSHLPFLLGGTSNHFRTEALIKTGGWDAWNVTEDADLAIRLVRSGYRMGDCPSVTWEEAPANLGSWMRQRRRWMKGFMQSAATHSRHPLQSWKEMGSMQFLTLTSLSLGTVLSAMLYPLFWVITVMAIRQGDVLAPVTAGQIAASSLGLTLFAAGFLAMFGPPVLGAMRRKSWGLLWAVPFIPIYALLITVAAWWALIDWMISPFHWHKTEHGFARNSLRSKNKNAS